MVEERQLGEPTWCPLSTRNGNPPFANHLQLFSDLVSLPRSLSLPPRASPSLSLSTDSHANPTRDLSSLYKPSNHHPSSSSQNFKLSLFPSCSHLLLKSIKALKRREIKVEKMVGVFGRSLSFPNKNPALRKPPMTHHARSVSLPSRSHPLLSSLRDQLSRLNAWSSSPPPARSSDCLAYGLSHLRNALDSLDDALHLPQAQSLLRTRPELTEELLEDFLCFADAYGIFQCSVLAFKEAQMAVQVAIRKKDESKIASYMKARKRIHKEMRDLTSTIKCVAKCGILHGLDHSPTPDAELVAGILGVVEATALVSLALFDGLASSFSARRSSWSSRLKLSKKAKVDERIEELECTEERLWSLRKMKDEEVREVLRKMEDLEGCVECIESGSERVFRSLISARVSLLNTLTM